MALCASCHEKPVSRPGRKFCSLECSWNAKRSVRPVTKCPVCRIGIVRYPNVTCGKSCALVSRADNLSQTRLQAMRDGQRDAFVKRMAEFLREQFAPVADRVPMSELAVIGARIYRKGKTDGQSLAYFRYVIRPRRHSGKVA